MWENETSKAAGEEKKAQELYPAPARRTAQPGKGEDSLLLVQCILCIAIVMFVLLVRAMDVPAFDELRMEFTGMLNTGMNAGKETDLVRFVNNAVEQVRATTGGWVEQIQQTMAKPSGGFWPVDNTKKVPDGASLESYTVPETLLLPVRAGVTSEFGFRKSPINRKQDFHAGIDWGAPQDTPVLASLGGQVVETGYNASRGNYIVLHHRAGLQTLYQHLACGFVRTGENVTAGQSIATVGSTGMSTGPHLHFELIVDTLRVDPGLYFTQ